MAIVLGILLIVVMVAGLVALVDDDGNRSTGSPPGSTSPTPVATGPPGDLSVEKGPRQCRVGRVDANLFYFDVQLALRWAAPDGRPAPSDVVVQLTALANDRRPTPTRYAHDQNLRPTGRTGSDVGYYRLTGDKTMLGGAFVLTVHVDSGGAVTETDPGNNTLSVLTFMPDEADLGTGPGVQFECTGI
jgi:hypothetical protein